MNTVLQYLQQRNPLLFYAGLTNFFLGIVCRALMLVDRRELMGVSLWLKPFKFFISIFILQWTMALYLGYLQFPTATRIYCIVLVTVMAIEMIAITWQASFGRLSHFNVSSPFNGALFTIMGIAIFTFTVWTAVIGTYFFVQSAPEGLPLGYWWGIRLGIVLFVVFALEGGLMAARLQHTVGAPDGGPGIPMLNWSRNHGDLRIAHFVGMHALQVLPLLGYFIWKRPFEIMIAAAVYGILAVYVFIRSLGGKPLFW